MYFYIVIASIIFWGGLSKHSKIVYKIGLFLLFILTAFRNTDLGGADTYVYQQFFAEVPKLENLLGYEAYFSIGFTFLNSLVKQFTDEYIFFQIMYALLSLFLIDKVIKKMDFSDKEKCIFLFSYFCFHFIWNNWIIYRQNLSNLFFWYITACLYKTDAKEKTKRVVLSIAAIVIPLLFHSSALANIVLLPVMLVIGKWSEVRKKIWVSLASIAIYVFGNPLYQLLIDIMATYVNPSYANYGETESNFINYVLRLVFFVMFAWHYKAEQLPQRKLIMDMMVMTVLIGSFNAVATTRMFEFFAVGLYASMTCILHYFSLESRRLVAVVYWLAQLFILCRFVIYFDEGLFMQYTFFF